MFINMKIGLLILSTLVCVSARTCIPPTPLALQLILEYVNWKSWEQIVLFTELNPNHCTLQFIRPLIECFGEQGVTINVQPSSNPNIPVAFRIHKHRIGAIVLMDGLNLTATDNVLQVASQKLLFNYYISWLLVTSKNTDTSIDGVLRDLHIGINSEVVVANSALSLQETGVLMKNIWNETCPRLRRYFITYSYNIKLPENPRKKSNESAIANLNYVTSKNRTVSYYFFHVYKIRMTDNTSLVTDYLGTWNSGMYFLRRAVNVKSRLDFKGLPIIFGVLNGTNDGQTEMTDQIESNDIEPLLDFANFVANSVNASVEFVPHDKLGQLNNKVWSHLLGDVVSGTVDIGLGYITIDEERLAEMSFSHPLIRYMRNIYYHPLESGTMRDIFLQPFTNRLLGCVALTYIIIVISMGVIIYAAKAALHDEAERHAGIGEAVLWCISIMCMQGSPWNPRSPSGKTLLLFSLIFALVTYNAYAGFITSILSVQATKIRTIEDLLSNNFKLGYSITDDEYIRNANDSNLRRVYIKAFRSRESRLDIASGLMKAVKGQYGFFVSATFARRALKNTLIQERCTLRELALRETFTVVALPMAKSCPYKQIINLSILRIQERGLLNRIAERMMPDMPKCKALTTFHSARLADVYSAFIILLFGIVVAASLGIFERVWSKRKLMQQTIVRGIRNHHLHLPHLPHLPHFPHLHLHNFYNFHHPHENPHVNPVSNAGYVNPPIIANPNMPYNMQTLQHLSNLEDPNFVNPLNDPAIFNSLNQSISSNTVRKVQLADSLNEAANAAVLSNLQKPIRSNLLSETALTSFNQLSINQPRRIQLQGSIGSNHLNEPNGSKVKGSSRARPINDSIRLNVKETDHTTLSKASLNEPSGKEVHFAKIPEHRDRRNVTKQSTNVALIKEFGNDKETIPGRGQNKRIELSKKLAEPIKGPPSSAEVSKKIGKETSAAIANNPDFIPFKN
ncbi:uncharacterized protein [Prorops nasuta]|uniref:uncharacterized protein n=1 Tax=Prorops nasuta TaxID=863751 RepID=UPI0034CD8CDA